MNTHVLYQTARLVLFAGLVAFVVLLAPGLTPRAQASGCTSVTNNADSGAGSLRDCITSAGAGSTINFDGNYTINLTSGELLIDKNLTIDGGANTIVINGPGASCSTCFRVFNVSSAVTFNLSNLTVANGHVDNDGGGIYNSGTLTVQNSTISGNSAGSGGGIYNDLDSTLTVTNSTISGNSASNGGGIYNDLDSTLTVTNSTISDNSASNSGGGILNSAGTLTVTNTTFADNTSTGGEHAGGGIYIKDGVAGKDTTITNSTFSANDALDGAAIKHGTSTTDTVTLRNTIVANTTDGPNCSGTITNGGNNIDDGTTCGFDSTNRSMSSTNPQLGTLTNGVFPLNANSPAIDGVTYLPPNSCPTTDQRGQARDDLACDIGAYEMKMTDGNWVSRAISKTVITMFGPARVVMLYSGTDPGVITATKVTNWTGGTPTGALGAWWELTAPTSTGLSLGLQLCYSTVEVGGLTEGDLRFWRYSAGTWSQVGGAPTLSGTTPNRCAQIDGVTDLSRWTLATTIPNQNPTAVTLSSFKANAPTFDLGAWLRNMLGR